MPGKASTGRKSKRERIASKSTDSRQHDTGNAPGNRPRTPPMPPITRKGQEIQESPEPPCREDHPRPRASQSEK